MTVKIKVYLLNNLMRWPANLGLKLRLVGRKNEV